MRTLPNQNQSRRLPAIFILPLLMLAGGNSHALEQHESGHASHNAQHDSPPALVLDHGKKWQTDESLRTGMQNIRALVVNLPGEQTLNSEKSKTLAANVQTQVNFMISHCKLAPEADAVLHVLIADLIQAADTLRTEPAATQGLSLIHQVLVQYPEYFDHPGWVPVAAGH